MDLETLSSRGHKVGPFFCLFFLSRGLESHGLQQREQQIPVIFIIITEELASRLQRLELSVWLDAQVGSWRKTNLRELTHVAPCSGHGPVLWVGVEHGEMGIRWGDPMERRTGPLQLYQLYRKRDAAPGEITCLSYQLKLQVPCPLLHLATLA